MTKTIKAEISIDKSTYKKVETLARLFNISRNRLFVLAIER